MRWTLILFTSLVIFFPAALAQNEIASLHPQAALIWQRTSPSPQHPDGPVLYQLLFSASGTPGTVPVFDTNPRHLANSPITVNNGVVTIGGSNGLVVDSAGSALTFAGVSLTGGGSSGLTVVSHDATLAGSGTAGFPLGVANGGVTTTQISSGNAALGQLLTANGAGGTVWQSLVLPSAWSLSGNSGTNCTTSPCTAFLGTTDTSAFEINVNSQRGLRIEPASSSVASSPNLIGGFSGNSVTNGAIGAVISGGGVSGGPSSIASPNAVSANGGTIGGGFGNSVSGDAATIAGGSNNTSSGQLAVLSGGTNNIAGGDLSTVSGGANNTASALDSTVAGGNTNSASAFASTVAGGYGNSVTGKVATAAGGAFNSAGGLYSITTGGVLNVASGDMSLAAGAYASTNTHKGAFVWGDASTFVSTTSGTYVAATADNQFLARATGGFNFIAGIDGSGNPDPLKTVTIAPNSGVISFVPAQTFLGTSVASGTATTGQVLTANGSGGAGWTNAPGTGTITGVTASTGLTGGGTSGTISLAIANQGVTTAQISSGAAGNGQVLTATGSGGTSWQSLALPFWSLSGNSGTNCSASPCSEFLGTTDNASLEFHVNGNRVFRFDPGTGFAPNIIGGFAANSVTGPSTVGATISGGGTSGSPTNAINTVGASFGTIAGGYNNSVGGISGTVSGGDNNAATGDESVVAGGTGNKAASFFSTVVGGSSNSATGQSATALGGINNLAGGNNSTTVGGSQNKVTGLASLAAGTNTTDAGFAGVFLWGDDTSGTALTATANDQFLVRASGGVTFFTNAQTSTGVTVAAGSGSWSSISDRNVKAHFNGIDSHQLLARVLALPITTWNYKSQDANIRHLGPMAQDFYAAFHLGEDDKHITTIDEGGVALAAIQGLNQKLEAELKQKDDQISALAAQLAAQSEQIKSLQREFAQLRDKPTALEARK